jgi:general secretion pathway protein D
MIARIHAILVIVFASILIQSCAYKPKLTAENPLEISEDDYESNIEYLSKRVLQNPNDIKALIMLQTNIEAHARKCVAEASTLVATGGFEDAIGVYDRCLLLIPDAKSLKVKRSEILSKIRFQEVEDDVSNLMSRGRFRSAIKKIQDEPDFVNNRELQLLLTRVKANYNEYKRTLYVVDLKFSAVPVKQALRFISEKYGINVVFDDSVKDTEVNYNLSSVPYPDALDLLLSTTNNEAVVLNDSTIMVFANTKDRVQRYVPIAIRTFALQTTSPKDMAAILKSAVGIKNITINESSNSIIIRERPSLIELAEEIIRANDLPPGEVVLDVEILEVNTSKAKRIGIDYGNYQLSTTTPAVPTTGSISTAISEATNLNVPSLTLNAFKQAVDAKSLARPSIRVIDGEKAKIHIGDRVPLRKSNIQDATGQTRTTFEYQEIGIRLGVQADIHSDEFVTVQVNLEVSSLGENLGTAAEPAFRIGTRNAESTMMLNTQETAILGGLLRDETRSTESGFPGALGVPYVRRLLGSEEQSAQQTDLLLTITPRIVRKATSQTNNYLDAIGTESDIGLSQSILETLSLRRPNRTSPAPSEDDEYSAIPPVRVISGQDNVSSENQPEAPLVKVPEVLSTNIQFSSAKIIVDSGDEAEVNLTLESLELPPKGTLKFGFNGSILEILKISLGDVSLENLSNSPGRIEISLDSLAELASQDNTAGNIQLKLNFRAQRRGTSFLTGRLQGYSSKGEAPLSANASVVVQ